MLVAWYTTGCRMSDGRIAPFGAHVLFYRPRRYPQSNIPHLQYDRQRPIGIANHESTVAVDYMTAFAAILRRFMYGSRDRFAGLTGSYSTCPSPHRRFSATEAQQRALAGFGTWRLLARSNRRLTGCQHPHASSSVHGSRTTVRSRRRPCRSDYFLQYRRST